MNFLEFKLGHGTWPDFMRCLAEIAWKHHLPPDTPITFQADKAGGPFHLADNGKIATNVLDEILDVIEDFSPLSRVRESGQGRFTKVQLAFLRCHQLYETLSAREKLSLEHRP